MFSLKLILLFVLLIPLFSCTYHTQSEEEITPMTYETTPHRSIDSIGKLRRLVLMPVEVISYKGKYTSKNKLEAAILDYENICTRFLTEKKGYDIVVVRGTNGKWETDLFESLEYKKIETLNKTWRKESAGKHSAPVIQKIGTALNVDGILAVWIKEREPWDGIDGILNIALMNIPLFYNIASPNIGAWIYETATGNLVWSEEHSTFGNEPAKLEKSIINLFTGLENAVPKQLIDK